jgi:hypothetical protein
MGNLQIDFDDVAREIGEVLDMVQYGIMAAKSPDTDFDRKPNFSRILISCAEISGQLDFILDRMPPRTYAIAAVLKRCATMLTN